MLPLPPRVVTTGSSNASASAVTSSHAPDTPVPRPLRGAKFPHRLLHQLFLRAWTERGIGELAPIQVAKVELRLA
jgi:hypothetical protein